MDFRDLTQRHLKILLEQIDALNFEISTVKSAKLIVHEASHYFDHLVTLSGQEMLVKIYSALNECEIINEAIIKNEEKPQAHNIIKFLNTLKNWSHTKFANELSSGSTSPGFQNWSYYFETTGDLDIFNKPSGEELLTVTFKYNDTPYVRVPFTMESLWETNAMWAEIIYQLDLVSKLEGGARAVEGHLMQKEYEHYLYNPGLFVYSIAAHLVSSFANLGDIPRAFILSKALCSISLNLPFKFYEQIKRTQGTVFNGLVNRLLNNTTNLNPTFIFLALLENIVELGLDIIDLSNEHGLDINKILAINNLPDKLVLNREILSEINELSLKVDGPHTELYTFQKDKGLEYFKTFGIEGGLNQHPAYLIAMASRSKSCVFQGWDEEAFEEGESEAFKRQEIFEKLIKYMIT
ncbi:hypothetical protein CUC15_05630 [Oceanobacillus zhaokaii]|uniref:Uncharacterized protein n=1 Tax=Oceanobacillus zhaokaii TaxID=2052660 RepID=A0A345PEJ8_9BACI|nr:hypothetical protein [Oceanobacillus zhaokaii]AXI08428.1 hypothetical protein CUC15_05630 [Oceanobacillus zhaokaii]